jgi:hypothetical protein
VSRGGSERYQPAGDGKTTAGERFFTADNRWNLKEVRQVLTRPRACSMVSASLIGDIAVAFGVVHVDGRQTMSLARPFHVVMVFAAFLFVSAIVLGAI